MDPAASARPALPAWRRLAVRLAVAFAALTFLSVAIVGVMVRARQKAELQDAVGTQLLNIARVAVLLVDPAQHAEIQRAPRADSPAYRKLRARLADVQREVLLTTPIRTLVEYDRTGRRARVVVTSEAAERPGEWYALAPELIDPIAWSLEDGVARYTRFAEHGDPAGVMAVLNDYLGHMADIVIAHGGTINEFIGDAIFAVFGAPVEHLDHAERAAATALAMQLANDALNRSNAEHGRPSFEMGIGLHTGEAVVGNIGSEQRTKYAVVGAAVNLAARVEGCTVGGQILMTAATAERLADLAEVAPPISVELKGLTAPVALYELRGLSGRFAQRLPEAAGDAGVEVHLSVVGAIIEDKRVHADAFTGTVRRLGRRSLRRR